MKIGSILKKAIYITVGIVAMFLGGIGIVLPLLPTTPLLLLALYCFTKSSGRLSAWFKRTAFYKKYLAEYVQTKSLTLKQKVCIQVMAGVMMIGTFVILDNIILKSILVILFLIHNYIFIFKIETRRTEKRGIK